METYGWVIQSVVKEAFVFAAGCLQQECRNDVLIAVWQHIGDFDPNTGSFQNWEAELPDLRQSIVTELFETEQKICGYRRPVRESEHAGRARC